MSVGRVRKQYQGFSISWQAIAKILAGICFLLLLIISLSALKSADFFPIKGVKVFGLRHLEHGEVQELVTPFVSKGFFGVDVDQIKEQLIQLPWVAKAVVRRVWPDGVIIAVNEKKPIALWNNTSILSASGVLFSPPQKTYPQNLPQLAGPAGEHLLMAQFYAKMNSVLLPLHVKITRLELTPSMAWNLTLDSGMKMSIGHKDVLTRLNHFVKVYPKIVGNRVAEVEYIDLRYPNGMAVRWKSVT